MFYCQQPSCARMQRKCIKINKSSLPISSNIEQNVYGLVRMKCHQFENGLAIFQECNMGD